MICDERTVEEAIRNKWKISRRPWISNSWSLVVCSLVPPTGSLTSAIAIHWNTKMQVRRRMQTPSRDSRYQEESDVPSPKRPSHRLPRLHPPSHWVFAKLQACHNPKPDAKKDEGATLNKSRTPPFKKCHRSYLNPGAARHALDPLRRDEVCCVDWFHRAVIVVEILPTRVISGLHFVGPLVHFSGHTTHLAHPRSTRGHRIWHLLERLNYNGRECVAACQAG